MTSDQAIILDTSEECLRRKESGKSMTLAFLIEPTSLQPVAEAREMAAH